MIPRITPVHASSDKRMAHAPIMRLCDKRMGHAHTMRLSVAVLNDRRTNIAAALPLNDRPTPTLNGPGYPVWATPGIALDRLEDVGDEPARHGHETKSHATVTPPAGSRRPSRRGGSGRGSPLAEPK
jgi:hypothetical protein